MAGKSVAVLDIRSSEIAVFVGERGVNRTFIFKASKTERYEGYAEGVFLKPEGLLRAVKSALATVEQICGEKFKTLYIGVPGDFIDIVPRQQELSFSKRTKISQREIDMLFDSGKEKRDKYRLIRVTSMIYITSDNRRVANPVGVVSDGLKGVLSYFYCSEYFASTIENIFADKKIKLRFLPTQFAMGAYLIPPETRDECAVMLDVGYLSSTICVLLGNGVAAQQSFWVGQGQIAVRLMEKFHLSYDAALALLTRSNLYLKKEAENREFTFRGKTYDIPAALLVSEVKAGLDDICEKVSLFMEACATKELDSKPLYVTGEGLEGIRGALEHMSRRLNTVCEQLFPQLPYYNRPSMSSRIALIDMAYEDNRLGGSIFRNIFGG